MKSLIKISLLFLLVISNIKAFAHKESSKYAEQEKYTITKRYTDSTLKEGTTKFIYTFQGIGGLQKKKLIRLGLNKSEYKITTDTNGVYTQTAKKGNYKLYFYQSKETQEVITDTVKTKNQEVIEITVRFQKPYDRNMKVKKPVIYVYPEETTEVNIQLEVNGDLSFTYPEYKDGWDFTATRDGNITMDGKQYNYLFWESEMPEYALDKIDNTGFLVDTDTLLSFLENSLDQMGLNSKESADFITFWYPQMMVNEKNHVQFLFNESCDAYAKLNITPTPDQIYRVGMLWKNATTDFIPETQIIPTMNREGFTVIEWGGMESELLFLNEN